MSETNVALQFAALVTVLALTFTGGLFGYSLNKGVQLAFWKYRLQIVKPICTFILIPPPAFQSWTGAIIRNTIVPFLDNFPDNFAQMMRVVLLGLIMFRCGLNLQFRRFSVMVALISVVPLFVETVVIAFVGRSLFGMPNDVSAAMGCLMASAGTAVIVPALVNMIGRGYGNDKRINQQILIATVVDNVVASLIFSISKSIVLNDYYQITQLHDQETSYSQIILRVFIAILIGIGAGVFFGFLAFVFKYIKHQGKRHWLQFTYSIILVVGIPVASEYIKFPESRYIALVIIAYIMRRIFKKDLPFKKFDELWFYTTCGLYGTMGAELNFRKVTGKQVWKSFIIIGVSLVTRFTTSFIIVCIFWKLYTMKEKIFISITWCPKGSIQAALAYSIINGILVHGHKNPDYEEYGYNLLCVGISAVLLTQPTLAMIINNIGPKLLTKDQVHQNDNENQVVPNQDETEQKDKNDGMQENQENDINAERAADDDNNDNTILMNQEDNPEQNNAKIDLRPRENDV